MFPSRLRHNTSFALLGGCLFSLFLVAEMPAGTKTWDGKHDTEKIHVTVVYFVPSDRPPLHDWKDRAMYQCRRIEQFHDREFYGQSNLNVTLHDKPLVSRLNTAQLRQGNADAIFFRTLRETDARLKATAKREDGAFPILLVLSEINWRPLDDFYRLSPRDGKLVFEGMNGKGAHFPGARSGGARATYIADRALGWGLVSADGWRVPYRGTDCVVYHEGVGHTVGLPHPEPGNGSVMSMGQYKGWLSESWLDREQKLRLGWTPTDDEVDDPQLDLFTTFRALPTIQDPRPGQQVDLKLDWPEGIVVESLQVRYQTAIDGPWIEVPQSWEGNAPATASLAAFERETPVSYRVDAKLKNGATGEIWGYFQVRRDAKSTPQPFTLSRDLLEVLDLPSTTPFDLKLPEKEVDLLAMTKVDTCWQTGKWSKAGTKLQSPKLYGARIELPYSPPAEYRLTAVIEALDEPNGLLFGQRSGGSRFVTLLNHQREGTLLSALENIDGRNVGNESTFSGKLFRKGHLSQVISTVRKDGVSVSVDGRPIIRWQGAPDRLSLGDYWKTPNDAALFIGAYDCRYRIHRLTLEPISGEGKQLESDSKK